MALTRPRAYQIYDIDYKQAVRVVSLSNVTLAGGAPNAVDGVNLSLNDRILVAGQTSAVQNGIYYVTTLGTGANGTWARSIDTDATGELLSGTIVMVTEGSTYADTQWKLTTNDPITIGVTALTFVQNYLANSISYGSTAFAIGSTNANATISVAATSNVAVFSTNSVTFAGNLLPTSNITYSLGTTTQRWKDLWISNSTIYLGNITLGATDTQLTVNSSNVVTSDASGTVSTTGNITGGNILTAGLVSATGNVQAGNLVLVSGNLAVGNTISYTSTSNISGWNYSNVSLSIAAQEGTSSGVFFGNVGNSFYLVGTTNSRVFQYNMSSTNMANTGVLFGNVLVSGTSASPQEIFINSTGANMYVVGQTARTIAQYTLSTPWNITTAVSAALTANVSAQEATPTGVWFKSDLTTMYVVGSTNNTVYQYTLSNAGNVASATYASKSYAMGISAASSINLSSDGTKMWVLANGTKQIYEYVLTTPYDVSTATITQGALFGVNAQETGPQGIYVDTPNTRVWVTGTTADTVFQYSTANSLILSAPAIGIQGQLNVLGNTVFGQQVQFGNQARFGATATFDSVLGAGSTVNMTTTTGTISIGTSQTTGTTIIGGTAQTGNLNIGRSTATQGIVIGNGVTASGSTKTIDIGTLGAANSITNINIGPTAGNATVSFLSNALVSIANTSGAALSVVGNITGGNVATPGQFVSTIVTGTAPMVVASTTKVTNLNVEQVDGYHADTANIVSTIAVRDAAGNITAANYNGTGVSVSGNVVSAGNVSGTYLLGNVFYATGISANKIYNGTTEVAIGTSGGNANITVGGTSNVVVFDTTGEYVTGLISASGNITSAANVAGGNILATTIVSAASHIGSIVSVSANITGGNILTAGLVSATGNITSDGNISGTYILGNGSQLTGLPATYGNTNVSAYLASGTDTSNIVTTGNVSGGNVLATTIVSGASVLGSIVSASGNITSAANVTGGNLITTGIITSAGNLYVGNILTNGYYYANGTAFAGGGGGGGTPGGSNTYVQFNDAGAFGGTAGFTFTKATNAIATSGTFSATGNITGGNIITSGVISATGNITGGNLITGSGTGGNLTGANVISATTLSATANVVGGNLTTSGQVTATGNITSAANISGANILGGNVLATTISSAASFIGGLISLTGNIDAGNINTIGTMSVTGDITSAGNINGGNSNITTQINTTSLSASGNIRTAGTISATGTVIFASTVTFSTATAPISIGTSQTTGNVVIGGTAQTGNLQIGRSTVSQGIIIGNGVTASGSTKTIEIGTLGAANSITNINIGPTAGNATVAFLSNAQVSIANTSGAALSVAGNVTGGNVLATTIVSGASHIGSIVSVTGNVNGGNLISAGTITTAGNIVSSGTNATANIGSATTYFNTVHAKATSAQYADVAEYYASDAKYESGTVVSFGGEEEVTICNRIGDDTVAGVVSTNPAYIMNAGIDSTYSVPVALTGRVPTKVLGPVRKGNMMISAGNGYAQACSTPAIGTVIGKAIENFDGTNGIIEIVVGRV